MNILNAKKRNSNWKQEIRELPEGARQSLAESELTLEQLAEDDRSNAGKNESRHLAGDCVGADGNSAVKGRGHDSVCKCMAGYAVK